MTTPVWTAGTLYAPGSLVVPRSVPAQVQTPPTNPGFETGTLTGWTATAVGGVASGAVSSTYFFEGSKSFLWAGGVGSGQGNGIGCELVNNYRAPVVPGQVINASARCMSVPMNRQKNVHSRVRIYWFDASNVQIGVADSVPYGGLPNQFGTTGVWVLSTVSGTAPPGAAFASIGGFLTSQQASANGAYMDAFEWDYVPPAPSSTTQFVFRATQVSAGYSAAVEPTWPITLGGTVVDNEVTWTAVTAARVTWEADPILLSGGSQPTFPAATNATVQDNGKIAWVAMDHRVKDPKCPHSKIVAIAAKKVFAADEDIVAFSATVNPLDWSTPQDAGYIPFGLNTYGATPVKSMNLYRGNLVIANEAGYQMWQVDEDPANMALLDAVPIGCRFNRSMKPVSNDLVMLTDQGIRNIGIAGGSTNLQAGFFGKAVDPLVIPALRALAAGDEAIGLFWPGAGQYWLFFDEVAFVLTMNGGASDMSWSRYVFPATITDWTLHEGSLLLRMGNTVLKMDEDILGIDDFEAPSTGTPFEGYMAWHYLDAGVLGYEKQLEGLDLIVPGNVRISIGYNQKVEAQATPAYAVAGDTLTGAGMLPFSITAPSLQIRLTFDSEQYWEWSATNLYVVPGAET